MKQLRTLLVGLATVAGMIACEPQAPDEPNVPKTVALQGEPETRFVGTWRTKDGRSTYILEKDGSYRFSGKVRTAGGEFDNTFTAQWRSHDGSLLFADVYGHVTPYKHKLDGQTLTLDLKGRGTNKTVLVRK